MYVCVDHDRKKIYQPVKGEIDSEGVKETKKAEKSLSFCDLLLEAVEEPKSPISSTFYHEFVNDTDYTERANHENKTTYLIWLALRHITIICFSV